MDDRKPSNSATTSRFRCNACHTIYEYEGDVETPPRCSRVVSHDSAWDSDDPPSITTRVCGYVPRRLVDCPEGCYALEEPNAGHEYAAAYKHWRFHV